MVVVGLSSVELLLDSVGEGLPCLACVALTRDEKLAAFCRFSPVPSLFCLGRGIGGRLCGLLVEFGVCSGKGSSASLGTGELSKEVSVFVFSGAEVCCFGVVCCWLWCGMSFGIFSTALYGFTRGELAASAEGTVVCLSDVVEFCDSVVVFVVMPCCGWSLCGG